MSIVEEAYQKAIDAMTTAEKIERMVKLMAWGRENVARNVIKEMGPLPPEELKWQVALWIYGGNPESRRLIEGVLENVSNRGVS